MHQIDKQEKIYREWNDGAVYCYDRKITYSQCNLYGRLKFSEFLIMLSEGAGDDYTRRGLPYYVMAEQGVVFLLSKMSIKFHEDIKGDTVITFRTWEYKLEGVRFFRNFDILSEDGRIIAQAQTIWLAVNPNTRKILRPAAYPYHDQIRITDKDVDCIECGKIKLPEEHKVLGSRRMVFSDIDVNGHVNNTRYIAFAEDCLPEDLQLKNVSDIRINFVNEAKLGESLNFFGGLDAEHNAVVVVGKKDDGTTSFECEFWLR